MHDDPPISNEHSTPASQPRRKNLEIGGKHPLEYVIAILLVGTLAASVVGAVAAHRQGNAAHKTLNEIRDQEHRQLRAYVGIPSGTFHLECPQGCTLKTDRSVTGPYLIQMFVKNFGSTPALRPKICANAISISHVGPVDNQDITRAINACGEPMTIWPSDTVLNELKIRDDQITSAIQQTSRLFVVGYVEYDDIFGTKHWSWYCSQYNREGSQNVFRGCDRQNFRSDI